MPQAHQRVGAREGSDVVRPVGRELVGGFLVLGQHPQAQALAPAFLAGVGQVGHAVGEALDADGRAEHVGPRLLQGGEARDVGAHEVEGRLGRGRRLLGSDRLGRRTLGRIDRGVAGGPALGRRGRRLGAGLSGLLGGRRGFDDLVVHGIEPGFALLGVRSGRGLGRSPAGLLAAARSSGADGRRAGARPRTSAAPGLNAGSNVEYQGVAVGRVRDIQLTRDIPPKVAVIVDLEPGIQVRQDTVAALLGSIVTGIQYIELQGGSEAAGPLPPDGVIPGNVSSLLDLRDRLAEIGDIAITILARLERDVFTEANSVQLSSLVANLAEAAERLNSAAETFQADEAGRQVVHMIDRVSLAADAVNTVFTDFYAQRGIYANLGTTLVNLDAAVDDARGLVAEARTALRGTEGSASNALRDLTLLTRRLEETLDVIEADPSLLVRGREIQPRELPR